MSLFFLHLAVEQERNLSPTHVFSLKKRVFHNLLFYLNKTIILVGQGPQFSAFVDHFLGFCSELVFTFVLGNVEFDPQNTALSGPRVCCVHINLSDFKGKKRRKHILKHMLIFIVIFGNRHQSRTGA